MTLICKETLWVNIWKYHETVSLLTSLGFTIHKEKSVLEPKKFIEFLGFIINSTDMIVKLNAIKSQIIMEKLKNFLDHQKSTTRQLASVIDSCLSLFSALPLGSLQRLRKIKD